jgi:hypothetical protein
MEWGLGWGLLAVLIITLVITYAIVQETRAQRHWRGLVKAGDVNAIRTLIDAETKSWRTQRLPRGVLPSVWHGVQTAELVEVGSDHVRVSCSAEGQYAVVGSRREEVSSALREAMKVTAKLADMLLYDVPNVELDRVQIDVYTTFRARSGAASQRCILSTTVDRVEAKDVDWDEWPPEDIIAHFGGRYRTDQHDHAQPIDPDEAAIEAEPPADEAHVS